jgi:hypothetical protein
VRVEPLTAAGLDARLAQMFASAFAYWYWFTARIVPVR